MTIVKLSWGSYTTQLNVIGYKIHRSLQTFTPSESTVIATLAANVTKMTDEVNASGDIYYAIEAITDNNSSMFSDVFKAEKGA